MPLPEETLQRLARLGFTSERHLRFWQDVLDREGQSFLEFALRRREEDADEYARALPLLQAFAADCRRANPARPVESFSPKEHAQYRILLEKMQKFASSEDRRCVFRRWPNHVAILSTTPFVGLTAAQQVFGDTDAIVLVDDEHRQWSNGIGGEFSAFGWCAYAWWTIDEDLPAEYEEWVCCNPPVLPEGSSYWVVESGVQWGDLAGGADVELWRWDGTRAEFVVPYTTISY